MSLKLVFVGDDEIARGRAAAARTTTAQEQGREVRQVFVSKSLPRDFFDNLGVQNMFGADRLWHIRGLESLTSPKEFERAVTALAESPDDSLLEFARLTPAKKTLLTKLGYEIQNFALPAVLFQFLEAIGLQPLAEITKLLSEARAREGEWALHTLLARQFRLLLAARVGAPVGAPPFAVAKLTKQANQFAPEDLAAWLSTLYRIEIAIKSGKTKLTWSQQFDIALARFYADRAKPARA